MKKLEEILKNYGEYKTYIQDRLGTRLCDFLTEEQAKKIGFKKVDESRPWPEPKEWTRENILKQLQDDVDFGFEKALNMRGISSSLMYSVVLGWNRILEEGLEGWGEDNYAQYGLPLFKATAEKYGWENPIGEDTGREFKYAVDECFLEELCIPTLQYLNDSLGFITTGSREGGERKYEEWEEENGEGTCPHLTFHKEDERLTRFFDYMKEKIPGSVIKKSAVWKYPRIVFPIPSDTKKFWEDLLEIIKEWN